MEERVLSTELVRTFAEYLVREERSSATCEKYLRDIRNFSTFACNRPITKELVMAWKKHLLGGGVVCFKRLLNQSIGKSLKTYNLNNHERSASNEKKRENHSSLRAFEP